MASSQSKARLARTAAGQPSRRRRWRDAPALRAAIRARSSKAETVLDREDSRFWVDVASTRQGSFRIAYRPCPDTFSANCDAARNLKLQTCGYIIKTGELTPREFCYLIYNESVAIALSQVYRPSCVYRDVRAVGHVRIGFIRTGQAKGIGIWLHQTATILAPNGPRSTCKK